MEEDCVALLVTLLDGAQREILVQASSLYVRAYRNDPPRRPQAAIILDKSQRTEQYSSTDFLAHAGIPTYIDA